MKLPKFNEPAVELQDEDKKSRKRLKAAATTTAEEDDSVALFKEKSERELAQQAELLDQILASADASKFDREWTARRIDFIITPIDQLPFAILGWTGSRQFERSIRLYSEREFGWRLTSHGIYDHKKARIVDKASSLLRNEMIYPFVSERGVDR